MRRSQPRRFRTVNAYDMREPAIGGRACRGTLEHSARPRPWLDGCRARTAREPVIERWRMCE